MTTIPPRKPQVVVTGLGAVCGWGWGIDKLWSGLLSGKTAIKEFHRFDHKDYFTHVAAEVPEPENDIPKLFPRWSRLSFADRYAVFSAYEAIQSAGLQKSLNELRTGVFFGSSTGGMFEGEEFYFDYNNNGNKSKKLGLIASHLVSCPGQSVGRFFRVTGPVQTESSACASGTMAIAQAYDALLTGEVEIAIAGGADSLCRITFGGFNSLRTVDEKPSLPFRRNRAGLSIGEGGAALILENFESVHSRGATPIAELVGTGSTNDAYHMTAPHPKGEGAARALRIALENAGLTADSIDFMNAHGTGTPHNDVAEWNAMKTIFREKASLIPITSTKACVGHFLGSAGTIEAVATILCLKNSVVHPTPGDGEIDPETPVNLIQGNPLSFPGMRNGVSMNLAFGGCNAALVFSSWKGV